MNLQQTNLQETIAELEQQATKYTEAANALRALLPQAEVESGGSGQQEGQGQADTTSTAGSPAAGERKKRGPKAGRAKADRETSGGETSGDEKPRIRKKRVLSDETPR
jgi:hypothetical protein